MRRILLTSAVLLIAVSLPGSASAEPEGEFTAAELADLQVGARASGVTTDQYLEQMRGSVGFATAADIIRRDFPDSYSDAAFIPGSSWVSFKEDAPSRALDMLAELTIPVEIVEDQGWSAVEREAVVQLALDSYQELTGTRTALAHMNPRSNEVEIVAQNDEPAAPTGPDQAAQSYVEDKVNDALAVDPAARTITVRITRVGEDLVSPEAVSEGTALGLGTTDT